MPDIDNLMQEWPAGVEQQLGESGLPIADLDCDLPQYVDIVCSKYKGCESKQNLFKYNH
jgi:intraflagellar transport protein 46